MRIAATYFCNSFCTSIFNHIQLLKIFLKICDINNGLSYLVSLFLPFFSGHALFYLIVTSRVEKIIFTLPYSPRPTFVFRSIVLGMALNCGCDCICGWYNCGIMFITMQITSIAGWNFCAITQNLIKGLTFKISKLSIIYSNKNSIFLLPNFNIHMTKRH